MKSTENMPKRSNVRVKPISKDDIRNTGRVERILKLAKFLGEFRSIEACADHINVHRKSVHRYLNLLSQLGFKIEYIPKYRHQYRITNLETYFKDGNKT